MTKEQFIADLETKPQFIKWAKVPLMAEKIGEIEKWNGIAYITTPDGTNTFNVWFIVDAATNEATWQQQDTLEPEKNVNEAKMVALTGYLKATFSAYFILRTDLPNNWAEADVYTVSGSDLAKSTVMVFQVGTDPITHLKIV